MAPPSAHSSTGTVERLVGRAFNDNDDDQMERGETCNP